MHKQIQSIRFQIIWTEFKYQWLIFYQKQKKSQHKNKVGGDSKIDSVMHLILKTCFASMQSKQIEKELPYRNPSF